MSKTDLLLCKFDRNFKITYTSQQFKDYFCRTREMYGDSILSIFPEQEQKLIAQKLGLLTPRNYFIEQDVQTPDNRETWMKFQFTAVFEKNCELLEYHAVVEDITDAKAAQLNRERLQNLVELSPFPIIIVGKDRADYVNQKFIDTFGYTLDDIPTGQAWFEKAFPDETYRNKILAKWFADVQKKEKFILSDEVYHVTCKNGRCREVNLSSTFAENDCFIIFFNDLTELLKIEAEKKSLTEQLIQSQKLEAIGQLAGGIAHDFNNMLQVITGSAGMLKDKFRQDRVHTDLVNNVLEASRQASGLTGQLLAFSRKQVLEMKVLNPNSLIEGLKKTYFKLLPENISFESRLSPEPMKILADQVQMQQVLINLVLNARDAISGAGRIAVESSSLTEAEAERITRGELKGRCVMFTVSDTGCGMDNETIGKIFEPFFTTKEIGKGTGLGLSTVYGIVMQHCGRIMVESEPGKGSIFKVLIPMAEGKIEKEKKVLKKAVCGGYETLLLIEDDPAVLKQVSCQLVEGGYRVLEALNPVDALKLAKQHGSEISLMVSDVVLPYLSGKELYRKLSTMLPDLKVVYISGYTNEMILQHGILDKGVRLLIKPFSTEDLLLGVRDSLDSPAIEHCAPA
ncbi:MAG: ATP-binding protein [Candidatus Wallbacteria bacterium]|nr:ATP-binding protein [Candidatus Wallbacteria bacterium]